MNKKDFVSYLREQSRVLDDLADDIDSGNFSNSPSILLVNLDILDDYLDCLFEVEN